MSGIHVFSAVTGATVSCLPGVIRKRGITQKLGLLLKKLKHGRLNLMLFAFNVLSPRKRVVNGD